MSIHFLFLFKFIHSLTVLTLNVPNIDSSQPFYPFPIQIEYNIIILTTKGHYLLKQDDNSNYSLQALSLGNSFTPDQTSLSLGVVLLNEYVEDSISYMLFMNNKMIIVTSKEGEELSNIQHLIGNVSTKSKVSGTIKSFSYAHFSFIQEGTYFYEFLFIGSNNSIYSIIESTKTLPQMGYSLVIYFMIIITAYMPMILIQLFNCLLILLIMQQQFYIIFTLCLKIMII